MPKLQRESELRWTGSDVLVHASRRLTTDRGRTVACMIRNLSLAVNVGSLSGNVQLPSAKKAQSFGGLEAHRCTMYLKCPSTISRLRDHANGSKNGELRERSM